MLKLIYSVDLQAIYLQQSTWVDNMVEQKPLLRFTVFLIALLVYLAASVPAMSCEEPEYNIVKKTDVYEVRQYKKRTVAEVVYGKEDLSLIHI